MSAAGWWARYRKWRRVPVREWSDRRWRGFLAAATGLGVAVAAVMVLWVLPWWHQR